MIHIIQRIVRLSSVIVAISCTCMHVARSNDDVSTTKNVDVRQGANGSILSELSVVRNNYKYFDGGDWKEKVEIGMGLLETAVDIGEKLANAFNKSGTAQKFIQFVENSHPYAAATVAIVKFAWGVTKFFLTEEQTTIAPTAAPTRMSEELKAINALTKRMEIRMTLLGSEIVSKIEKVKKLQITNEWSNQLSTFTGIVDKYNLFMNRTDNETFREFKAKCDADIASNMLNWLVTFVGTEGSVIQTDFLEIFRDATEWDRKQTTEAIKVIVQQSMLAEKIIYACIGINNYSPLMEQDLTNLAVKKMKDIRDKCKEADEFIETNWASYADDDAKATRFEEELHTKAIKLREEFGDNHAEISSQLFAYLSQKYDWIDFMVLSFDEKYHNVGSCENKVIEEDFEYDNEGIVQVELPEYEACIEVMWVRKDKMPCKVNTLPLWQEFLRAIRVRFRAIMNAEIKTPSEYIDDYAKKVVAGVAEMEKFKMLKFKEWCVAMEPNHEKIHKIFGDDYYKLQSRRYRPSGGSSFAVEWTSYSSASGEYYTIQFILALRLECPKFHID